MKEFSKTVPIASILGSIEGTLKVMLTDANYVLVLLQSMSREYLLKIQNVLDAHNQVMKYNTLSKLAIQERICGVEQARRYD